MSKHKKSLEPQLTAYSQLPVCSQRFQGKLDFLVHELFILLYCVEHQSAPEVAACKETIVGSTACKSQLSDDLKQSLCDIIDRLGEVYNEEVEDEENAT